MKKKLFSAIMAVVMIATLALPAFAGSVGSGGATEESMTYTTNTQTPSVTVTMPTTKKLVLNPYGMTVNINNTDYTDQIVNPTDYITNLTQAPLKVGVKATATRAGNTILVTKPCTGKEVTNNAFLMVELAQAAATTDEPDWIADMTDATTINEKCYPQIIPIESTGKTNAAILSVDKTDGSTANYIAVKVLGNLAGAPTGGWTEADTANVTLVFTFTPSVANTVTLPTSGMTASKASAIMGTVVRLVPSEDKTPVVKDANDTDVTVTKVAEKLYYFTMPATAVTVTAGT